MCNNNLIYEKTKNHNTNYYRRNKILKFNINSCPHCSYETTGPKSALQAHIWAKHTPESERPFQCPNRECKRGFSSRANLHKHILKKYNIKIPKIDRKILLFHISLQSNNLKDELNDKIEFYKENKFILLKNLPIQYKSIVITWETIYYDYFKKIIILKPYTREDIINCVKKV
mgnify:CR=1 FL=1|tara:strand:+ start:2696 stop:3214 length:519 start_codon:yes stop_codon:yes gene_type:complete